MDVQTPIEPGDIARKACSAKLTGVQPMTSQLCTVIKPQVSIILGYEIKRELAKSHGGWKSNTVAEEQLRHQGNRLGPQKGLFGQRPAEEREETKDMTYIPFYGPISGKISRMLRKHGIKTIHKLPTKIQNLLRPVKEDLGFRTPGVYRIPCECGKCYIGQTGRTVMERCKEHQRIIRLYYPDKSAVAQHSLETGHKIDFGATTILDKTSGYWDLVIKEAIEIQLDGNNFNRDRGLQLSTAWKPAINTLRQPAHGRQSGPASSS
ncbi:hypothetical protein ANN_12827 [Periplaneta americana]|uniref:GIY-YIG domain-containing protein n=1 Tax=Periplaneta americana TaxID=6978 RepID=A0ABQ8TJW0_PERAM|nr:hypothetical protein ANN_12827 [Periplaneta americana]